MKVLLYVSKMNPKSPESRMKHNPTELSGLSILEKENTNGTTDPPPRPQIQIFLYSLASSIRQYVIAARELQNMIQIDSATSKDRLTSSSIEMIVLFSANYSIKLVN